MVASCLIPKLILANFIFIHLVNALPRLPTNEGGGRQEERPEAEPSSRLLLTRAEQIPAIQDPLDSASRRLVEELVNWFGSNELFRSINQFFSQHQTIQASSSPLPQPTTIPHDEISRPPPSAIGVADNANRRSEKDTSRLRNPRLFDDPILAIPSSELSYSLDSVPSQISKKDQVIPFNFGNEWKKALFGRGGILTEVFNFVNDKRKGDLEKAAKSQADLPNSDKLADFTKIIDSLLKKSQSGNFDEPLPEIPFIGICNRLSCGDIYKAIDEFRKSELFSNFQTALSLMHDPKGWDVIGELLSNPELIENFTGAESLQEMFGSGSKSKSAATSKAAAGVKNSRSGEEKNIGIDFSSMVDEHPTGVEKTEKAISPAAISENIDAPDYYSFAEKGEEVLPPDTASASGKADLALSSIRGPDKTSAKYSTTTFVPTRLLATTTRSSPGLIPLPEIAESIDELPEGSETLTLEKVEKIPSNSTNHRNLAETGAIMVEKVVNYSAQKRQDPFKQQTPKMIIPSTRKMATTTTPTTTPTTTTTKKKKNFRLNDDYYSMYYDG